MVQRVLKAIEKEANVEVNRTEAAVLVKAAFKKALRKLRRGSWKKP
jgi:hypothetical protein